MIRIYIAGTKHSLRCKFLEVSKNWSEIYIWLPRAVGHVCFGPVNRACVWGTNLFSKLQAGDASFHALRPKAKLANASVADARCLAWYHICQLRPPSIPWMTFTISNKLQLSLIFRTDNCPKASQRTTRNFTLCYFCSTELVGLLAQHASGANTDSNVSWR